MESQSTSYRATAIGASVVDTRLSPAAAQRLARTCDVDAANFLDVAFAHNPNRASPILWLMESLQMGSAGAVSCLSLEQLMSLSRLVGQNYLRRGICPRDVVAVQTRHQILYLLHYFALSKLGAIPALLNDRLPQAEAKQLVEFVDARCWVRDSPEPTDSRQLAIEEFFSPVGQGRAAEPAYGHHSSDPVLITHSSGTTGRPKAVFFRNSALLYGPTWRMRTAAQVDRRILCAMPLSHNAGIAFPAMALLLGSPMMILNDFVGESVLDAVESFSPSKLVGFAQTFSDLANRALDRRQLSSLKFFSSTADCVHEAHIRRLLAARDGEAHFIDNFGSSELAFALFRKVFGPNDRDYGRRVGLPLPFVDAQVANAAGHAAAIGEPGMLAVRSPTLAGGYWNNSPLTFRSSRDGYWLTGDTVIQLPDGEFVHLDREVDSIRGPNRVVYTLPLEERILLSSEDIADCSVVAAPGRDETPVPVCAVRLRGTSNAAPAERLEQINRSLRSNSLAELAGLYISTDAESFPLGATGKVLKRRLEARLPDSFARHPSARLPALALGEEP